MGRPLQPRETISEKQERALKSGKVAVETTKPLMENDEKQIKAAMPCRWKNWSGYIIKAVTANGLEKETRFELRKAAHIAQKVVAKLEKSSRSRK